MTNTTATAGDLAEWELALMAKPDAAPAPILGAVQARDQFWPVWGQGMCPETDGPHYLDLGEDGHSCYVCGARLSALRGIGDEPQSDDATDPVNGA